MHKDYRLFFEWKSIDIIMRGDFAVDTAYIKKGIDKIDEKYLYYSILWYSNINVYMQTHTMVQLGMYCLGFWTYVNVHSGRA